MQKVIDRGIGPRYSGSRFMVAPFSQGYKWRDLKRISRAVDFTAALWGNMCFRGTGEKWSVNNFKAFNFYYGPEQSLRLYQLYPEKWDLHTVETAGMITGLLAHYLSVHLDHGGAAMWESLFIYRDDLQPGGSMPAVEIHEGRTSCS